MSTALDWLAQRRKAILGFIAPGVGLLAGDFVTDQRWPTEHEWSLAAVACVLTALGVHTVKNRPKR